MKLFKLILLAAMLTGCASSGGPGAPEQDAAHARAIARAHTDLAASYYERAQYGVALQEIGVALQADDGYAPAYNVRALLRMALHEDKDADADFRRSLRLDSASSETYNNYGWFMCQRDRVKESLKEFQKALDNPLYATPELAYVNLGLCARKAGLTADVEDNLQRALILRPNMPAALYGLAAWRYDRGDFDGANSYFSRFLQTAPELNSEQLWLAVHIARKANDRDGAASYALQLRNRFPDSRETKLLLQGK